MPRKTRWALMIPFVAAGACADITDPVFAEPGDPATNLSKHAQKPCHKVRFTINATPISQFVAEGTLSGDLEGTVRTEFDPESVVINEGVIRNRATVYWTITGGKVPGLKSFVTKMRNKNVPIDPPGSFGTSGWQRELSGVRKARLRHRGTFSPTPTPHVVNNIRGRICL